MYSNHKDYVKHMHIKNNKIATKPITVKCQLVWSHTFNIQSCTGRHITNFTRILCTLIGTHARKDQMMGGAIYHNFMLIIGDDLNTILVPNRFLIGFVNGTFQGNIGIFGYTFIFKGMGKFQSGFYKMGILNAITTSSKLTLLLTRLHSSFWYKHRTNQTFATRSIRLQTEHFKHAQLHKLLQTQ